MASMKHPGQDGQNRIFSDPVPLVYTDKENKLVLDEDVLGQLSRVDTDIYAVSVVGPMRQGKSYLMNMLANRKKAFPLGHAWESETKGIWILACPHPVHKGQTLLLLDTEGLGDLMKEDSTNHDNKIFTIALLLCSTLIYNQIGAFDQRALNELHFVTEISNNIKISSNNPNEEYDVYFPTLIIVLRDYCLRLEFHGQSMTPDEYLNKMLEYLPGSTERTRGFNKPRECLRNYFKDKTCFTFDRPVDKREKLYELETITDDELTEDFKKETQDFLAYVWNHGKPMKLPNGKLLNGRMFANLAREIVTAVISGEVPCVESALRSMAIIENGKAVEKSVQVYVQNMNTLHLPTPDIQTMSDAHMRSVTMAIETFLASSLMDDDRQYQEIANGRMLEKYEDFKELNETNSTRLCTDHLKRLHRPINEKIKAGVYNASGGYAVYKDDFSTLQDTYKQTDGLGIRKHLVLLEFVEEKQVEAESICKADQQVGDLEKQMEIERLKAEHAERREAQAKLEAEKREDEIKTMNKQMEDNITQLRAKQEEDMDKQRNDYEEVMEHRIKEHGRLIEEGYKTAANEMKLSIKAKENESQRREEALLKQTKQREETLQKQITDLYNRPPTVIKKGGSGCCIM